MDDDEETWKNKNDGQLEIKSSSSYFEHSHKTPYEMVPQHPSIAQRLSHLNSGSKPANDNSVSKNESNFSSFIRMSADTRHTCSTLSKIQTFDEQNIRCFDIFLHKVSDEHGMNTTQTSLNVKPDKRECKNVKFSLLGRLCTGPKTLSTHQDLLPVIGVDVKELPREAVNSQAIPLNETRISDTDIQTCKQQEQNENLEDTHNDKTIPHIPVELGPDDSTELKAVVNTADEVKSHVSSEVMSSTMSEETDGKRYSYSSGENQDFDNSDGDSFIRTAAGKFESVNVWDEEYTLLKNKLLGNDPLVFQEKELEDPFTTDFDRVGKTARKRKGKKPTFVQSKVEDPIVSTSEEESHDEFLSKSHDTIYATVDRIYDNEPELSSPATPEMKRLQQKLHPFAITSPSFNKAAAPAVMTTSIHHTGTVVTISIVTKKSQNTFDHLTSSNLSAGGIMSLNFRKGQTTYEDVLNETNEDQDAANENETKKAHLTVMEKLKAIGTDEEEKLHKLLDRMEINVQILDSQLIQHGEQKRWQCQLCSKSYTTKHNLVTHILDHNGIKPHLCMVCGKYFKQLSHLNTHMLTHDNIKPHICNICGKEFTQISHLKRHQTVHLDSRPYICDLCGRGFAYPSELRTHKEKHNSEKEKCEECGEEFESIKALKLHMVVHENREELICKHCGKVFRYPSQLKDHMITHEGSRPYICTECGMDFMKVLFNRSMKSLGIIECTFVHVHV